MRKTAFPEEIAADLTGGAAAAIPRPRVSCLHHMPLSARPVAPPVRQILHLDAALVTGARAACRTARGDWLALTETAAARPPPASAAQSREITAAIMGLQEVTQGDRQGEQEAKDWTAFLTGTLPRILLAAQTAPARTPVLVDAALPAVCRDALALCLPDHPLHDLAPGAQVRIGRLHAARMGDLTDLGLCPQDMGLLARLRAAGDGGTPAGGRILLWSGQTDRRLRNAPALRAALEARGCVPLDLTDMPLSARIATLSAARDVVLADPALLGDALLAPEGARLFALLPKGAELHRWALASRIGGQEVTVVIGSAPYRRLRNRLLPWHRARVFHVEPHLILPFLPGPAPHSPEMPLPALLDALYGASFEADVLTGAWAVHAGPTPAGFEARLRHLRARAAAALLKAPEGELDALFEQAFFVDFARNIRSGFPVLGGFTDAETALAARLERAFAARAAGPEAGGAEVDPAFAGPQGARRLLMLGMLLLPAWQVALPLPAPDLPEAVLERWAGWAMVPPALIRAGEDAAWARHVERLLHWLADRLERDDLSPALRLRLARLAGRIDLGQLLLIDQPLRAIQTARNRVLARVAQREGGQPAAVSVGGAAGRRIRIGILCRTFDKGPDSEAVVTCLAGFDPARYEIFAYSIGFRDRVVSKDPAFDRLFAATLPNRRDLPEDPAGIRAVLRADGLDVFLYANATTYGLQPLDLALYHRVAPLQIVLNSHVPMGLGYPSFDAMLTGQSDDPAREVPQEDPAERLIRLPGPVINYLTTLEPRPNPPLDRAALGLSPQDVVLMNAGSSMKLRHETLVTMMRAVAGVPQGVLLLAPYNPGWAARSMAFVFNRQIAETAAEAGLDPARIRVLGELSVAEAEAALSCADLYLNPFPHGGATMTHLALIHGIPPVTLRRRSTRSIDQFLVESHGFAELLADTPEDYIALVQSLATNPDRRNELRSRLRTAARNPGFVNNPDHPKTIQNAIERLLQDRAG